MVTTIQAILILIAVIVTGIVLSLGIFLLETRRNNDIKLFFGLIFTLIGGLMLFFLTAIAIIIGLNILF